MKQDNILLAIVIPCHNEQEALPCSVPALLGELDELIAQGLAAPESFIFCVDDGSEDATWEVLEQLHLRFGNRLRAQRLAHVCGHQKALFSGLMAVKDLCDAAVSIDADMQDDPAAIGKMLKRFASGEEIVYGVRHSRKCDSWFKRTTARLFYKMQHFFGLETVYDHADYRLMSRRALQILSGYEESNLFLRGLVPQIGLKSGKVYYDRHERIAGKSKYPLKKMIAFSVDGITSFSARPIRMIFFFGLLLMLLDMGMVTYILISYFSGNYVPGWSSLIASVWFLGSAILMALGIIGEYIGKLFFEVKKRPRYNIIDRL